jgi:predicted N-acyltransferase
LNVDVVDAIARIPAAEWDALAGQDDPFVEHAFLAALESSGSASAKSGWAPVHVVCRDERGLCGALTLYAKTHSYGEFIFDWGWADAAERTGVRYYPKLVSMAPFTPATGRRLLIREGADRPAVVAALLEGVFAIAHELKASSIHLLFLTSEERELVLRDERLFGRLSLQFHWHNEGYTSFDDYLARFRHSTRKQVRRERRAVAESSLAVRVVRGDELDDRDWTALERFYRSTCAQYGSPAYLLPGFFPRIRETHAHRVVAALADEDGRPVAGSLNFEKGRHLYGRYWGTSSSHDSLHFELCYYRLIERAIAAKMTRFEAGAQGTHKLRRGLMPAEIHSAHWVAHPELDAAIRAHTRREEASLRMRIPALAAHGPFKRDGDEKE